MTFVYRTFICAIFFIHCSILHAGWNEDYDAKTEALIQAFPELKKTDFIKQHKYFRNVRSKLVNDRTLIKQLQSSGPYQKMLIKKN